MAGLSGDGRLPADPKVSQRTKLPLNDPHAEARGAPKVMKTLLTKFSIDVQDSYCTDRRVAPLKPRFDYFMQPCRNRCVLPGPVTVSFLIATKEEICTLQHF
eukprot:scaffold242227_cov28-Prasinocladus_malaysianus.AAC.1